MNWQASHNLCRARKHSQLLEMSLISVVETRVFIIDLVLSTASPGQVLQPLLVDLSGMGCLQPNELIIDVINYHT